MKIVIGVIVLVALVAAGAFFVVRSGLIPGLGSSTQKFTLVKESGSVSYKEEESDSYTELFAEEMELPTGSFIKTDKESFARVFMPDNSLISIDVSTEIQVNFEGNKTDVQQLIGKTWNRVQTLTNGGEFKVETPNTVAAVRGTIFGVGVDDDDHSRVFSIEDTINVGKHEKGSDEILEDKDITEGTQANITKEDSLEIDTQDTDEAILNSLWGRRNQAVDEEWQKIKDQKGDLLDLLKKALQKRDDYTELRLGLGNVETDLSKIQDQLKNAYSISQIDADTCKVYSADQIQAALDQIKLYKQYVINFEDIEALFYTLKEACSDGRLNAEEAELLQELVTNANDGQ